MFSTAEDVMLLHGTRQIHRIFLCAAALALPGCATPVPDGTRTVSEIAHVLTRQEIVTGDIHTTRDMRGSEPVRIPSLHEDLLRRGLKDEELVDGSVVLGRTQYYRHNATSGMIRQFVRPATVAKGVTVDVGNVVELEIGGGGAYATVVAVRYRDLAAGQCQYRSGDRGAVGGFLDAINPIGGPGAVWLYCPAFEAEGWRLARKYYGMEWFSPSPQR